MDTAACWRVGIGLARIDEDAVDRGDVDDLGGALVPKPPRAAVSASALVIKNSDLTLRSITLSSAFREFVETAPQAAPALLTRDVELGSSLMISPRAYRSRRRR